MLLPQTLLRVSLVAGLLSESEGFIANKHQIKQRKGLCRPSSNENQQDESTLGIIKKFMGVEPLSPSPELMIRPTRRGLSGFSTDEELGFVAILTSADRKRSTHVVVSPLDKMEVRSAEALCMVQLSGGMDLGTAVLPPDLLSEIVADELEVEGGEIRQRLQLQAVRAVPNDPDQIQLEQSSASAPQSVVPSTPERDSKLEKDVVKFMSSVRNLPGLSGCTPDQVLAAMRQHSDETGNLNRAGFSAVLDTLRRGLTAPMTSRVKFELVVVIDEAEQLVIEVPSAFQALGLALRYNKEVQVSTDIDFDMDTLKIITRFPKFRHFEELQEDARIMDGFIPNMYSKARTLRADDRQQ
ncbi:hypothetical protein MHU86_14978 [Fragilaria crotonensis]|nr:hypothetical protein MHU86_14978 [Fragilaria crotonensis]